MSRHPDFVMHYEDNSCPLNDIFTHSDHDWTAKSSDIIAVTKPKPEASVKDITSVTDSLIDIQLLEVEPFKNCSVKSFNGHTSLFNTFPRDTDAFPAITDANAHNSLCVDSDQLNADELSDHTGFSGYFSETRTEENTFHIQTGDASEAATQKVETADDVPRFIYKDRTVRREVQKPPTTAGIKLEHLKAVFHLERPKAEKKLGLKRTTFSNLSRHYGISKWPFRTIRDALNRMEANKRLLDNASLSKERRRKLQRQQKYLHDVIDLIYKDPRHSRDSNTLAVLLMIVAAKDDQ